MELTVCGLSHNTAPVEVREQWALSRDDAIHALRELSAEAADSEQLILSTCNRTEFYLRRSSGEPELTSVELGRRFHRLAGRNDVACGREEHFYLHTGENAVQHLFRLAAGIDSMIVGESQILGQLKEAYALSTETGGSGKLFHRLFPAALRTGKLVHSETRISTGCITPGQAAVRVCSQELGGLANRSALIVGSGTIAELAAKALRGALRDCFVVNRTFSRAERLVERVGLGTALPWHDLIDTLKRVDIVISSTGSMHPILKVEDVAALQEARDFRPLVMVDLAIPRDFEPEVAGIPGVRLFNIDDLNEVVAENVSERRRRVPEAERIVTAAVEAFHGQTTYLDIEPVIRHLVERFEHIRLGELQSALSLVPPEAHDAVEAMSRAMVKKLLHFPIERLKSLRDGPGLSAEEVAFLRRLFLGQSPTPDTSE